MSTPAVHRDGLPDDLVALARVHGVAVGYQDAAGQHVVVGQAAVVSALWALGVQADEPAARTEALAAAQAAPYARSVPYTTVVRQGAGATVAVRGDGPLRLDLEDRSVREVTVTGAVIGERDGQVLRTVVLPDDLPLGWHAISADGDSGVLVVAPASLPTVSRREWGWMVQLYSLRSAGSWGVGDYADLRTVVARTAADGGGVVLVNPLHAETPVVPINPSPYSPGSRRFRSPLWLRVEDVPEHAAAPAGLQRQVADLRPPTDPERVPRDPAWNAKIAALELLWPLHRVDVLASYRAELGEPLEGFALFCALAEEHRVPWQQWPQDLRRPDSAGILAAQTRLAERVSFWCWLQLLVDEQLAAVSAVGNDMGVGVVHDLAVGVDAGGADAWALQDALALGTTVGAPPDLFNQQGQDWGLPPWRPDRLAEQGYAPFRELVRGVLRHAGGIRIDHVMGLFRLWWVPAGADASEGTYVSYDAEALLGILVLEATRAGAVVVGEDLGTVEDRVRDGLGQAGVLGSAVLWFETDDDGVQTDPATWRSSAMATVTTHDLPTAAGYLAEEQVRVRDELGQLGVPVEQERERVRAERANLLEMLTTQGLVEACGGDVPLAMHAALVASPSILVLAAFGDAVGDLRQPNLPGTVDQYPNWRLPVADGDGEPMSLEQLLAAPGVARLTAVLRSVGSPCDDHVSPFPPSPPEAPAPDPGDAT